MIRTLGLKEREGGVALVTCMLIQCHGVGVSAIGAPRFQADSGSERNAQSGHEVGVPHGTPITRKRI